MKIESVRGMNDLLPEASAKWHRVESAARRTFAAFGYREVRTPIIESTELFVRSVGETTDIVEKETYTFTDRNGKSLTLRPEGTAGIVRAYIESNRHTVEPVSKWFYVGPMYRHERPQKGRYREFFQIGAEAFGSDDPWIDAEQLALVAEILAAVKTPGVELRLNSLGCATCRPLYRATLTRFLDGVADRLCGDCQRRSATNPLRTLDCKNPGCIEATASAPTTIEVLCDACRIHFAGVQAGLADSGVSFVLEPRIVRGLDYYTHTTFEFVATLGDVGAQNTVCGGGRYDGLVAALGGPAVPGVGFAFGIERLVSLIADDDADKQTPLIFFATMGDAAARFAHRALATLRRTSIAAECDYGTKSLKAQLRRAGALGAIFVAIVGDTEVGRNVVQLKNMASGEQTEVDVSSGLDALRARLTDTAHL
ncbi:MAG: histidine--tRNA ligase [Deltaproteobacteria bacterium]|nr:histidine--tRNA ligase [Deltaproteobacteria bacterium]